MARVLGGRENPFIKNLNGVRKKSNTYDSKSFEKSKIESKGKDVKSSLTKSEKESSENMKKREMYSINGKQIQHKSYIESSDWKFYKSKRSELPDGSMNLYLNTSCTSFTVKGTTLLFPTLGKSMKEISSQANRSTKSTASPLSRLPSLTTPRKYQSTVPISPHSTRSSVSPKSQQKYSIFSPRHQRLPSIYSSKKQRQSSVVSPENKRQSDASPKTKPLFLVTQKIQQPSTSATPRMKQPSGLTKSPTSPKMKKEKKLQVSKTKSKKKMTKSQSPLESRFGKRLQPKINRSLDQLTDTTHLFKNKPVSISLSVKRVSSAPLKETKSRTNDGRQSKGNKWSHESKADKVDTFSILRTSSSTNEQFVNPKDLPEYVQRKLVELVKKLKNIKIQKNKAAEKIRQDALPWIEREDHKAVHSNLSLTDEEYFFGGDQAAKGRAARLLCLSKNKFNPKSNAGLSAYLSSASVKQSWTDLVPTEESEEDSKDEKHELKFRRSKRQVSKRNLYAGYVEKIQNLLRTEMLDEIELRILEGERLDWKYQDKHVSFKTRMNKRINRIMCLLEHGKLEDLMPLLEPSIDQDRKRIMIERRLKFLDTYNKVELKQIIDVFSDIINILDPCFYSDALRCDALDHGEVQRKSDPSSFAPALKRRAYRNLIEDFGPKDKNKFLAFAKADGKTPVAEKSSFTQTMQADLMSYVKEHCDWVEELGGEFDNVYPEYIWNLFFDKIKTESSDYGIVQWADPSSLPPEIRLGAVKPPPTPPPQPKVEVTPEVKKRKQILPSNELRKKYGRYFVNPREWEKMLKTKIDPEKAQQENLVPSAMELKKLEIFNILKHASTLPYFKKWSINAHSKVPHCLNTMEKVHHAEELIELEDAVELKNLKKLLPPSSGTDLTKKVSSDSGTQLRIGSLDQRNLKIPKFIAKQKLADHAKRLQATKLQAMRSVYSNTNIQK